MTKATEINRVNQTFAPRRIAAFLDAFQRFMLPQLRARLLQTPRLCHEHDYDRLAKQIRGLLSAQNLLSGQFNLLDLGGTKLGQSSPDFSQDQQYYVYHLGRGLGISFAYEPASGRLVMGTTSEIEFLVKAELLSYERQIQPCMEQPIIPEVITPALEVTAVQPREMPVPVVALQVLGGEGDEKALARIEEQNSLARLFRIRQKVQYRTGEALEIRIKKLVLEQEHAAASVLLFGGGFSAQEISELVKRQGLWYSFGDLLQSGESQFVAQYLDQVGSVEGAQALMELLIGKELNSFNRYGGLTESRKLAVVIFKLSLMNKGLVSRLFKAAASAIEPGLLPQALNTLHECQPTVFKTWSQFERLPILGIFNLPVVFHLVRFSPPEKTRPVGVIGRNFAPILQADAASPEPSAETALIALDTNWSDSWELEFALMDNRSAEIGALRRWMALGDHESAADFIFGRPRSMTEIASLLNLGHCQPRQIAGVLASLSLLELSKFLVIAVDYGLEQRSRAVLFDGFFDGLLFALAEWPVEKNADLFEAMIHFQEPEKTVFPHRQAAYSLMTEGKNPFFDRIHGCYWAVTDELCGRRIEYASPMEFHETGKLLPDDSAPSAPRAQVRFFSGLMKGQGAGFLPVVRLQAMLQLLGLGKAKLVRKYVQKDLGQDAFLGLVRETAEERQPFITRQSLIALFAVIDYRCGQEFAIEFGRLTEFGNYLELLNEAFDKIAGPDDQQVLAGINMLILLRDRRLAGIARKIVRRKTKLVSIKLAELAGDERLLSKAVKDQSPGASLSLARVYEQRNNLTALLELWKGGRVAEEQLVLAAVIRLCRPVINKCREQTDQAGLAVFTFTQYPVEVQEMAKLAQIRLYEKQRAWQLLQPLMMAKQLPVSAAAAGRAIARLVRPEIRRAATAIEQLEREQNIIGLQNYWHLRYPEKVRELASLAIIRLYEKKEMIHELQSLMLEGNLSPAATAAAEAITRLVLPAVALAAKRKKAGQLLKLAGERYPQAVNKAVEEALVRIYEPKIKNLEHRSRLATLLKIEKGEGGEYHPVVIELAKMSIVRIFEQHQEIPGLSRIMLVGNYSASATMAAEALTRLTLPKVNRAIEAKDEKKLEEFTGNEYPWAVQLAASHGIRESTVASLKQGMLNGYNSAHATALAHRLNRILMPRILALEEEGKLGELNGFLALDNPNEVRGAAQAAIDRIIQRQQGQASTPVTIKLAQPLAGELRKLPRDLRAEVAMMPEAFAAALASDYGKRRLRQEPALTRVVREIISLRDFC